MVPDSMVPHSMVPRLRVALCLALLPLVAGCAADRAGRDPGLGLSRDRYVLPPPPPPPAPQSAAERRALEAEWPPAVVLQVPAWPQPPLPSAEWRRACLEVTPTSATSELAGCETDRSSLRIVRQDLGRDSDCDRSAVYRARSYRDHRAVVSVGASTVVVVRTRSRGRTGPPRLRTVEVCR